MTAVDRIKCRCAHSGMTSGVGGFQNPGVCLQAFPSFLPHPLPAYSRHFSRGLCSETARKRLLRRLENYQHVSPEANVSRFSFICYSSETGMLYFNTTQIFCSTYHRQPSVCFTEASRFSIFFRVGKSLACHSPGKWCLCA